MILWYKNNIKKVWTAKENTILNTSTIEAQQKVIISQAWRGGWGSSCHTGGAHGILCFGCGKDITSQTANRCNILKPSYSKTLQVWKRLVVERFEELNVDGYKSAANKTILCI